MAANESTGASGDRREPLGFGDLDAAPGDHIGHFYKTTQEGRDVLVAFFKVGLEGRDKCILLAPPGSHHRETLAALALAGIDVEHAVKSGQLVVSEGKSEPDQLRAMLDEALSEIPEKFALLRWAGVMSWALKKVPTTEKLMEWETHCNTVEDPAAIFLCQYELATFSGEVVMDALNTHPTCIISNVIHQNPFFESPEAYLQALRHRESTALARSVTPSDAG